jgi:hypothetical protein
VKYFFLLACYFGFLGVAAVMSLWWAVVTFGRGEYLTVIVVLGVAVSAFGLTMPLVLIMRGRVTARAEFGADGTTIRPDRLVDGITKWGLIPTYLAVAPFAIFQPQGKIDIPLPSGNNHYLLIGVTGAAIYGVFDLWRAFRPGGVSFVRMATDGFEMSQGSSSTDREWSDVVGMTDRRPGKAPPFRAVLFIEFRDGRSGMQVLDPYTPGGEAMRKLIRFYWINADRRGELTDGTALQRLAGFEAA